MMRDRTMNRPQLLRAACGGMFVFGIVLAILGAMVGLPEMRERLGIGLARQGDIFLLLFFGVFLTTIVVGPMIDSLGNKVVLTVSATLVTFALVMFAFATSFVTAAVSAFALGMGGGGLNTAVNALVADLYTENRGEMLNILGAFFGFGALLTPLVAAIAGRFTIPQIFVGAAVLAGALAIAYLALSFPPPSRGSGFSLLASLRAAAIPGVMLFAFVLFFQSGNEASIGGWTSTYLVTAGASPRTATWILSGYWGALMIGRILASQILKFITKAQLVLAGGIGSAMGSAVMLFSDSIVMMAVGAAIVGLSFAPIYPTILAMAADRYQRLAGTIFGLLFGVGLFGGMLFPWAVGHISQRYGLRSGMILPLFGALMISILAVIIARGERASRPQSAGVPPGD